jgi:hypothetical protein
MGTSLMFANDPIGEAIIQIQAYHFPSVTSYGGYDASQGDNGISLGTFGVELNDYQRALYGSNNYKESEIHRFLNSYSTAGNVGSPMTKFDRIPSWMMSKDGFLKGLDIELRNTIVDVNIPCCANSVYESPDSTTTVGEPYTVVDKVFLPSPTELGYSGSEIVVDSTTLPYFKDISKEMRIKYGDNTPYRYWTRSPVKDNSRLVGSVDINGDVVGRNTNNPCYVVPMFNIG